MSFSMTRLALGASLALAPILLTSGVALADGPAAAQARPKVEVLIDAPSAKVVRITLAVGAILAAHTTPVHATVAALSGEGEVTIADKSQPLATHGAVFLPKEIPHAVKNTGAVELVLLVHHLKVANPEPKPALP
jgi:quercetin dioxygenase-like cupin family protein